MVQTLIASDHGACDIEPKPARRQKAVLGMEEAAMNTTVIAGELVKKHDPRESLRLDIVEHDLEELRSYVTGGIGEQLIEHALMHVHIAKREDELENRAHTYIVGQSQSIAAWSQTAERAHE